MMLMRPIDIRGATALIPRPRPSPAAVPPAGTLWSRLVERWRMTETQDEFDARQW